MRDRGEGMVAFLGVPADERLLGDDRANLPETQQHPPARVSTQGHDRLVAAGAVLTAVTLLAGIGLALYGAWRLLFHDGAVLDAGLTVLGVVLAGTHWGWVHVAEYVGLSVDARRGREDQRNRRDWLASVEPYPRFSVSTRVLDDASTRIECFLHRPVLTPRHTFTFVREIDAEKSYDAHTSAAIIAAEVESMRREARLQSDRLRESWEAASTTYQAALAGAGDDREHLDAQHAAAKALSDHINASLLEPPLVE